MKNLFLLVLGVLGVGCLVLLIEKSGSKADDHAEEALEPPQKVAVPANNTTQAAPETDMADPVALRFVERPSFSAATCPIHLRPVFGLGDYAGYVQRKRIIQSLGKNLSSEEINALFAYLYFKPNEVGLDQNGYDALGDVIMLKLEEQVPFPSAYTDHLVSVYNDTTRSSNWRDYCIQHLGTTYVHASLEQQPAIRQLFMDVIEQEPEIAGTVLLAMKNADMEPSLVSDQAMMVASGSKYPDASRLSALHVAADVKHPEALPLARTIADSNQTVHFRMAAMAVIGKLGDSSDIQLLLQYVNSSDIRLRESSKAALRNINDRQNDLVTQ